MEPVELVLTNRFPYLCRDHATVFSELSIIKPLDKLANLRDDWNKLVGWSCVEEQSARSTNSSLTAGPLKFRNFAVPCAVFLPDCCDKWRDHAIAVQSNPLNSESVHSRSFSSSWKYCHVRICSLPLSRAIDSVFPRGFSSGRRDNVKKP